jgi:hypothetical protein
VKGLLDERCAMTGSVIVSDCLEDLAQGSAASQAAPAGKSYAFASNPIRIHKTRIYKTCIYKT